MALSRCWSPVTLVYCKAYDGGHLFTCTLLCLTGDCSLDMVYHLLASHGKEVLTWKTFSFCSGDVSFVMQAHKGKCMK
jgi:hypothetical protein